MDWKHLLASITGTVDQALLRRHEYLVTENRILRHQIVGRVRLTDGERQTLAEIGQDLGKEALKDVATIVKPDTILGWHRKLVAQKCDGSQQRQAPGRPPLDPELEAVVATDCFTAEVWTLGGLVTYSVLLCIHLSRRQVQVAGMTPHPHAAWMRQIARHVTMAEWGVLSPGPSLIHDRDGKDCPALQPLIDAAGITRVPVPPRSPHLHADAERWVRSITEACLSRLLLCGEASLRQALTPYAEHGHDERNHQGKDHVLLVPATNQDKAYEGPLRCRARLGGLFKYYEREAACVF